MASGRGLTQIYGPGEIFINPTDVSGTSGTGLGYTKDGIAWRSRQKRGRFRPDERGVEQLKQVHAGMDVIVAAILTEWNAATIAQLFPGFNIAAESGMQYRKSVVLGTALTTVKLLWVPDDTANTPALYLRKAIPGLEETAAIRLMLGTDPRPVEFPIAFENMSGEETGSALETTFQTRLLANIVL